MDTASVAAKQRDVIQRKLTALDQQHRETESALTRERTTHGNLTAKRAKLLEELPGADDATAGYLHREIDSLESELRSSSRLVEGLSASLSRLTGERAKLHAEFREAQDIAEQERRVQAFTEFATQVEVDRRAAEGAFDALRSALFALNHTLVLGVRDHGEAGRSFSTSILDKFASQQHNPEQFGWKSHGFELAGNMQFTIRPMVKG
jgi:hypothetical protein